MIVVGLVVTFLGFLISFASLGITESANGRLMIVLVGIATSLIGIVGVINPAYVAKAIWRK